MIKKTAVQKRLLQNATLIVATRLIFEELRQHYPIRQLRDAMTIFNGQALKKLDRVTDGEYDVYGSGGKVGQFSDFLSNKPFVVIGRKGSAGKPTYAQNGGWVIDTAYYAQPNNEDIDTKFLFYALSSLDFSDDIISTAIPGINQTAIYKYDIPVPPLELQTIIKTYLDAIVGKTVFPELPATFTRVNQIVKRVEALIVRIAMAQSLNEEINKETDLLFSRALSGAYDEALSTVSGTERLEDLCTVITDGTHVTPSYMDDGIPFLSVKDITSGKINFSRTRFISPEEHAFLTKRCKPEKNDVLLTKVGTTGFAKAIDVDREFSIFVSLALLKIDRNRLLPKYTEYMLNSPKLREQSLQGTRGVGNKNLVLKFIKEYPMPAPPLDEQRRIVAYLDSVQARLASLRELQSATGEELSALLPSVLDRAFRGEL